jgi:hypothetical protein
MTITEQAMQSRMAAIKGNCSLIHTLIA